MDIIICGGMVLLAIIAITVLLTIMGIRYSWVRAVIAILAFTTVCKGMSMINECNSMIREVNTRHIVSFCAEYPGKHAVIIGSRPQGSIEGVIVGREGKDSRALFPTRDSLNIYQWKIRGDISVIWPEDSHLKEAQKGEVPLFFIKDQSLPNEIVLEYVINNESMEKIKSVCLEIRYDETMKHLIADHAVPFTGLIGYSLVGWGALLTLSIMVWLLRERHKANITFISESRPPDVAPRV